MVDHKLGELKNNKDDQRWNGWTVRTGIKANCPLTLLVTAIIFDDDDAFMIFFGRKCLYWIGTNTWQNDTNKVMCYKEAAHMVQ